MKHHIDHELGGHAMLYSGPLDLIEHARKSNENNPEALLPKHKLNVFWPGRRGNSWQEMEQFLHSPWQEGVEFIKGIVNRIKKADLPQPKDVRRKGFWSEDDGEVDLDRVLVGEPAYLRNTRRQRVHSSTNIAIISNLDLARGSHCNPSGIWFRSGCSIALADILEELGYGVEIWTWQLGEYVYPEPDHACFIACSPKRFGEPVDYDALADTMSQWFTTKGIWGAMMANPVVQPLTPGVACECNYETLELEKVGMKGWEKYLDLEHGTIPICIPMIQSWSVSAGQDDAAETARKVLQRLVDLQS